MSEIINFPEIKSIATAILNHKQENTELNSNLAAFTLESDAQIQLESLEISKPNDNTVSYRIDEVPFF